MSKNKFIYMNYYDNGYFKKGMTIYMVLALIILATIFIYSTTILYILCIITAVFLFKQGRDFSNKYEGKVYITLDNHSILINNQCIFSIKSKQSQKFNYKIIEKIEVVKNILNIYTDESNYKIRLRALSLEDEKKLLNIIDEKMKKFKA
ncbi:TPA: hypothetical protein KN209_001664 [Clostridioides difficile]|uniref:Uncharacterized protein n=11 Tax=Clostridioides difficile TaxID=1496 RepID=A0AB74QB09_CLODI|nr:hypothetical protein [Clostridioides difficile]EQF55911.1 hypothetical protein QGA_1148 [Clostridioides difficile CD181]EQH06210.1 hypothetical protein QKQ_1021 [Clostridioides difficile DA00196]EQI25023.1 hypothetical protein QOM_0927 [Clostridioides difficile Y155]OFT99895.1 hypothetical protein HMPREF3085_14320 [Clostridium sp. HMSC19E03]OFU07148.1 hypothetical protein HMPREF3080_16150 [Clostridium sp. HMSC19C11]OFU12381.1 hypothetical protein HMPREF3081_03790 [Clostridium sp. HMSC19D02